VLQALAGVPLVFATFDTSQAMRSWCRPHREAPAKGVGSRADGALGRRQRGAILCHSVRGTTCQGTSRPRDG
jgi:hypothetical protein